LLILTANGFNEDTIKNIIIIQTYPIPPVKENESKIKLREK
jgi:hypothetical protein